MWPPRRIAIAALAGLTILSVGLMLAGVDATDPTAGSPPSSASPEVTVTGEVETSTPATIASNPEGDEAGAPTTPPPSVPFQQTADGARSAAVAYLESTETGVTLQPADNAVT
jgi:hypothetical protein